jgi:hypothetical protein
VTSGGGPSVRARCLPAGVSSSRFPRRKDGTSADASHPPGNRVGRPRGHARSSPRPRACSTRASGADGRRAARAGERRAPVVSGQIKRSVQSFSREADGGSRGPRFAKQSTFTSS